MRDRRVKPPTLKNVTAVLKNQSKTKSSPAVTQSSGADLSSKQWEFKIVFMGDSGVGKTWLVERLLARHQSPASSGHHDNKQQESSLAASSTTIGVTVNLRKVQLADSSGGTALLQLWDTSGSDKYRNLARSYLPGAHCIVLVYEPSVGLQASRQALARWYAFAREAEIPSAQFAVVAISRRGKHAGGLGRQLDEATMAGVNFGRVFASSLCGCFFHHQCGGGGQRRKGLTPHWLADQLVRRRQTRAEAVARLLAAQAKEQKILAVDGGRHEEKKSTADGLGDSGCFWCHRLLCGRGR